MLRMPCRGPCGTTRSCAQRASARSGSHLACKVSCVQRAVRHHSLVRDARIITLKLQWVRWEAAHHRRILADIKFRGSPVASEPAHSVVKDADFALVEERFKHVVCKQCAPAFVDCTAVCAGLHLRLIASSNLTDALKEWCGVPRGVLFFVRFAVQHCAAGLFGPCWSRLLLHKL